MNRNRGSLDAAAQPASSPAIPGFRLRSSMVAGVALALAACSSEPAAPAANSSAVTSIELPAETASLPDSPAGNLLTQRCTACHSPDFLTRQPPLTAEKWKATVVKMREAYHAPIAPAEDDAIVAALLTLQAGAR